METSKDFDVNENLILANIIWNEWKKIQEKNGVKVGRMPAIIPQEVLLEIKSLKIPKGIVKIENGKGAQVLAETNGLETLKGIEKLENLENFSCVGSHEYVLQSEISTYEQYYQLMSRSENWKQNLEKEIKYVKKKYNENQLDKNEIKYIYECKKLKTINLASQRDIREFHLEAFPELVKLDMEMCLNLNTISGLSVLNVWNNENDNWIDAKFKFTGCEKLNYIEDLDAFLFQVKNANWFKSVGNEAFNFPLSTFAYLTSMNKLKLGEINLKKLQSIYCDGKRPEQYIISWDEQDKGGIYKSLRTQEAIVLRNSIQRIVDEISNIEDDQVSDAIKLAYFYYYVMQNFKYDFEKLDKAKDDFKSKSKYGKNAQNYAYSNTLRSSYHTMVDKKGVCVGFANLLNFTSKTIGIYDSNILSCSGIDETRKFGGEVRRSEINISNHESNLINGYAYDLTWDLGKKKPLYFMLNREEFEKDHILTLADRNMKRNKISVQDRIEELFDYVREIYDKNHVNEREM